MGVSTNDTGAKDDHAVALTGPDRAQTARFTMNHDQASSRELTRRLPKDNVVEVDIERPDGPAVEALHHTEPAVFVIPPGQLKKLRGHHGSAEIKDDRFEAYALADTIRTDHPRPPPPLIDTPITTAPRRSLPARCDPLGHQVATANQPHTHPQITNPGAATPSPDITSETDPHVLEHSSTQDQPD